jgi:hypothetical protein
MHEIAFARQEFLSKPVDRERMDGVGVAIAVERDEVRFRRTANCLRGLYGP